MEGRVDLDLEKQYNPSKLSVNCVDISGISRRRGSFGNWSVSTNQMNEINQPIEEVVTQTSKLSKACLIPPN